MNKVILRGNMANDPILKEVGSDKPTQVVNFTLAVPRFFRKSTGEKDKDVTFVKCEAWDSGATTISQFFKKGDPLLIEGSLKTENREQDGQKYSLLKVRVSSFERLYRPNYNEEENE